MMEAASASKDSNWNTEEAKHIENFTSRNEKFKKMHPEKFNKALTKYIATQKKKYMKLTDIEGLYALDLDSKLGKQYMTDQNFCLEYAKLNRKEMSKEVLRGILSQIPPEDDIMIKRIINTNHNHAEVKDGYVIHRKGATHAEKGMYGVIPGNMAEGSFIVKGKGNPESLYSSSHGAGRVLSRRAAREQLDLEEFKQSSSKLINNHTDDMLDESPKAYKDIYEVMENQKDLVHIVDQVTPLLNIKG
jgi:tRNA-splicing ligase RtcB